MTTSTEQPWTIGRLLEWTERFLGEKGSESPRLDAQVLLAHAIACKRIDLYARVTNQIIAELETGVRPWIQPWDAAHAAGDVCRPLRCNGVPYRGINVVLLWLAVITVMLDSGVFDVVALLLGAGEVALLLRTLARGRR